MILQTVAQLELEASQCSHIVVVLVRPDGRVSAYGETSPGVPAAEGQVLAEAGQVAVALHLELSQERFARVLDAPFSLIRKWSVLWNLYLRQKTSSIVSSAQPWRADSAPKSAEQLLGDGK